MSALILPFTKALLAHPLEIYNCEQGTPEWHACRLGIPTASETKKLFMKGKDGKNVSETRRKYLYQVGGERVTGVLAEGFSNRHMDRGKEMEAEARSKYAFLKDVDPVLVGFMRRGRCGASPDSLIEDDGLLEIKTKLPDLHIEVLLRGICPPDHYDQIQTQLMISDRKWCDFVSYWPRMPMFCVRVPRDEQYIETIAQAVEKFNGEVDELVGKIATAGPRTLEQLAQAA